MTFYRTGTVTATNGSTTITGSGTAFVDNVRPGWMLVVGGNILEIATVVSNTELQTVEQFVGSTSSGLSYKVIPTHGGLLAAADAVNELIGDYSDIANGPGAGLFPDGSAATPAVRFSADQDTGIYRPGPNSVGIAVGGTGAFVIGSAGQVLVTTSATVSAVVDNIGGSHSVLHFTSSGTSRGGIGYTTLAGGGLAFWNAGLTDVNAVIDTSSFRPGADNTIELGAASYRWKEVRAAAGTINTSDAREKSWRGALTEAEYEAGLEVLDELGFYQWNDAIAEKGPDDARYHFGVRAQQVWAIFAAHELVDPIDGNDEPGGTPYAFLCFDKWEAEIVPAHQVPTGLLDEHENPILNTIPAQIVRRAGSRYGIRPDDLNLFLHAVQARRQSDIEARLAALENAAA